MRSGLQTQQPLNPLVALDALVRATDHGRVESALGALIGNGDCYVLGHDGCSLQPVGHEGEPITSLDVIEHVLLGQPFHASGHTIVPLCDRQYPILAVRGGPLAEAGGAAGPVHHLTGSLFSHQLDLFDGLQHVRRSTAMRAAAQLQWDQLPLRAAVLGDLAIGAALEPAYEVAGDLYDFALSPRGVPTVLVVDAMGHGVTATLSACLAVAAARTARRGGASLCDQVAAADVAVLEEYDGDRFVTMVAVEIDDRTTRVVNAGHEPLRRGTTSFRTLAVPADPPLGLEGRTAYRVTELPPLAVGEWLCLLSDGAVLGRDAADFELGDRTVNEALASSVSPSALLTAHRLARAVVDGVEGDLLDDVTAVVVHRAPHLATGTGDGERSHG